MIWSGFPAAILPEVSMTEKVVPSVTARALTTVHLGRLRPATALNGLTTSHLKVTPAASPPPKPPASTESK